MATTSPTLIGSEFERAKDSWVRAIARTLSMNLARKSPMSTASSPLLSAAAPRAPRGRRLHKWARPPGRRPADEREGARHNRQECPTEPGAKQNPSKQEHERMW